MDCGLLDYIATVVITLLMIGLYIWMPRLYMAPPIRILLTLVTGIYIADYLYTSFLVGVATYEFVGWLIGFLALAFVFAVSFYLNSQILVLGALLLLTMYGYSWYVVVFSSIGIGVLFAVFVYYYELEYIGLLIWDSLFLSLDIMIGILALLTNAVWARDIPASCTSAHLNMLVVCDSGCASVAAIDVGRTALVITAIVLMGIRFVYVYYKEVCRQPKEVLKAGYRANKGMETRQEEKKEEDKGCLCSAWWFCCRSAPRSGFTLLGEDQQRQKKKKSRNGSHDSQESDVYSIGTNPEDDDKEPDEEEEDEEEPRESKRQQQPRRLKKREKPTKVVEKELEKMVAIKPSPTVAEENAKIAAVKPSEEVQKEVEAIKEVKPAEIKREVVDDLV